MNSIISDIKSRNQIFFLPSVEICLKNCVGPQRIVQKSEILPIKSIREIFHSPSDLIKLIQVDRFLLQFLFCFEEYHYCFYRASILHALSVRFFQNKIYTSIGPILVAINPFKWINDGFVAYNTILC